MSQFKTRLGGGNALSVLRDYRDGKKRFLCYTAYSDSESLWQIGVSDGVDVWMASLSEQEVKGLAGAETEANFISDVSCCLEAGEVELLCKESHLTLCLKTTHHPLELSLSELSAAQRRLQLQRLVFDLWTYLDTTRSALADCHKQLEARQEMAGHHVSVDVCNSTKPVAGAGTRTKRPVGASLVNPSLKRRKAVKGVVFGDSQDD